MVCLWLSRLELAGRTPGFNSPSLYDFISLCFYPSVKKQTSERPLVLTELISLATRRGGVLISPEQVITVHTAAGLDVGSLGSEKLFSCLESPAVRTLRVIFYSFIRAVFHVKL